MRGIDFGSSPVSAHDLLNDGRWALASRVAASSGFSKAPQLRELLLFLCRQLITSPSVDLTEQEIGSRVLGRRPDYDTQADNIVRVQMRHLRQKLDEYFASEGQQETLVLCIPKGSRVPQFQPRALPLTKPQDPEPKPTSKSSFRWVTVPVLALLAVAFLLGRFSTAWTTKDAPGPGQLIKTPLWMSVFDKQEPTTVVISDSSLAFSQDMLHTDLSMDELGKGSLRKLIDAMPDDKMRSFLREISVRQYTSMADATVSSRLASIGDAMGSKVAVRYSRHMSIRDFNTGNFVIVGSRRGIPWVELFDPELNFRLQIVGPNRQFGFLNKEPQGGEAATYTTVKAADGHYETFAVIAFLPNPKRTGNSLLLQGIMMEGTEAAGDFAMSPGFSKLLEKKLGATTAEKLPPFEVLLKIQAVSGAPNKVEVLAWRRPSVS